METLEQKYCSAHQCTSDQFRRRVFWKCLHRRAIFAVPIILLLNRDYFETDRALIEGVGRAATMKQVWAEIREYFLDPTYRGWIRRRANVRLSAHKLITLAGEHLPAQPKGPSTREEA